MVDGVSERVVERVVEGVSESERVGESWCMVYDN